MQHTYNSNIENSCTAAVLSFNTVLNFLFECVWSVAVDRTQYRQAGQGVGKEAVRDYNYSFA